MTKEYLEAMKKLHGSTLTLAGKVDQAEQRIRDRLAEKVKTAKENTGSLPSNDEDNK